MVRRVTIYCASSLLVDYREFLLHHTHGLAELSLLKSRRFLSAFQDSGVRIAVDRIATGI